nr:MAG TPA: DNA-directed RNA polymerase subunit alpha [Caudoviricetes sp.]
MRAAVWSCCFVGCPSCPPCASRYERRRRKPTVTSMSSI